MIAAERFPARPQLDDPWRRLVWVTPSALLLWAGLLTVFALLLQSTGRSPETIERLDARLIDLPAPAQPGGLQGGPAAEPQPAPAVAPPQPQPQIVPKREEAPAPRVKKRKPAPPVVYDVHGAHTAQAVEAEGAASAAPAGEPGVSASGAPGHGGAGGLGSDSSGARAIYAPVPQIPDDLRENVFEAVAVAHFHVSFDGVAKVSLTRPTSNPRLNSILLDTLKQWRFFPALRNGIAIDSEFDVRIPIAVRER